MMGDRSRLQDAGVLLTASNHRHSPQLTCAKVVIHETSLALWVRCPSPLWNFSSMGGTIWRTLRRTSLLALDIVGASDIARLMILRSQARWCHEDGWPLGRRISSSISRNTSDLIIAVPGSLADRLAVPRNMSTRLQHQLLKRNGDS